MCEQLKKTCQTIFISGILFCFLCGINWAAVAIQTEVVSGTIIKIAPDDSLHLDNGKIYHPSRAGMKIKSQTGQPITLRYTVEGLGKNIYFEYAPGLNSLPKKAQPSLRNNSDPK